MDRPTLPIHLGISWIVYAAVIAAGTYLFYDNGWRDVWSLPPSTAWRLRLTAFIAVVLISVVAGLLAKFLSAGRHVRALTAGLLTGLALHYLAGWIGDHYLGGYGRPDPQDLGRLMSEGYGMMMYGLVTPLIGILAFVRAEVDTPPLIR